MPNEDFADKPLTFNNLKAMIALTVSVIIGYGWTLSNFVTTDELTRHAERTDGSAIREIEKVAGNLKNHIDEQTIWKLETKLEDIGDKRWLVQQRISQPGGDTLENRKQVKDLEGREKKAERSLQCVRNGGNHCISRTDG